MGDNCDKREGTNKAPPIWGALGLRVNREALEVQGWLRGGR